MSRNTDAAPSWLTEENITTAANNPQVQKAAVKVASNPAVQAAAINHANKKINEAAPGWASTSDPEPVRASNVSQNSQSTGTGYVPPVVKGVPTDAPAWSTAGTQDIEGGNGVPDDGGRPRAMSDFVATDEEISFDITMLFHVFCCHDGN